MVVTGMGIVPGSQAAAADPVVIVVDSSDVGLGTCEAPTPGTCTLRSAVALANDHPGSTIYLEPDTYLLDNPLTITGAGTVLIGATATGSLTAGDYVIDAAGGQGIDINTDDVRIRGVTVHNAANRNGGGGAIVVRRNSDGSCSRTARSSTTPLARPPAFSLPARPPSAGRRSRTTSPSARAARSGSTARSNW